MKIKIKDKSTILPNCWKSCGVDKDAWDELQKGKEIEVKQIAEGIKSLVETAIVKATSKKESK
mgnify:CR=1 FL=1|tara:strand:- start:4655 stop:4843 length:189 start_codon:yes stop_codon:yes gene_type:complete